ncbi:MAG: hypothetical protein DRN03_05765 [Thermoplasmata archaeon]|nr:MAG: hypothetical protein DRN03_05765 [Thermoplasmata archaeon]
MLTMKIPRLSYRENFLRAVTFNFPEYIPCRIAISWPVWNIYRDKLKKLVQEYPLLFPGLQPGTITYDEKPSIIRCTEIKTDPFGCTWRFSIKGLQGIVVRHPLDDWSKLKDYQLPDPEEGLPVEGSANLIPWERVYESMDKARERGDLVVAGMPHGFFFQRLYYLRGFVNLMIDFIKKPPQLYELIDMLTEYNLELVKRLLKFNKVDVVSFGDDLGCQNGMPISPKIFKEFIFPTYKRIFSFVRSKGVHVRLHSDGCVVEVLDQLVRTGLTILNIQDLVNGLDNIARECKGKVCVDLDIDRQRIIPYGTAKEVKEHIRRSTNVLASRKGGLMFIVGIYPPTPIENIKALCEAFEEVMWFNKS